jgi:hypothetical protein
LIPQTIRAERHFDERRFDEDITEKKFKEQYRVPKAVLNLLEDKIGGQLDPITTRSRPLTARDQLKVFLHFLGTNSFYHVLRDCHGVGTDTVCRIIHRVADSIVTLRKDVICWPRNPISMAEDFLKIAPFPSVCGCVDGTHVIVSPPKNDEVGFVNRHHKHSLNVVAVCGPNLRQINFVYKLNYSEFRYVYESASNNYALTPVFHRIQLG